MDEIKAREILGSTVQTDGSLFNAGHYIVWPSYQGDVVLDCAFNVDELEAIAWWMRNKTTSGS